MSNTDEYSNNQYYHHSGHRDGYKLSPKYDDFESVEGSVMCMSSAPSVPALYVTVSSAKRGRGGAGEGEGESAVADTGGTGTAGITPAGGIAGVMPARSGHGYYIYESNRWVFLYNYYMEI